MPRLKRKTIEFVGSSLSDLRRWPKAARTQAGYQLDRVQSGLEPDHWKPFKTVGPGVKEIRIREQGNQYRVMYVQVLESRIHVLHCFRKKSQKTARKDIQVASQRFKEVTARTSGNR